MALLGRLFEVGDDVGPLLIILDAEKRHLVAGHEGLRRGEILEQRIFAPGDPRGLHCRRIIVAGKAAGFAPDHAMQAGTDAILAGDQAVARAALDEDDLTAGGIAGGEGAMSCEEDDQRKRPTKPSHFAIFQFQADRRLGQYALASVDLDQDEASLRQNVRFILP